MAYYKEQEFGEWLDNNYPSSAPTYKSGVGSLITWIDSNKTLWNPGKIKMKRIDEYLKETTEISERDTLFSAALNILQKGIQKPQKVASPSIPIGTLQNYKSYLCAYEEFFRSEPFEPKAKGITQSHLSILRKKSSNATYTKDELIKEFINRILTQDRISMSKEILFPIRLIRKLWKTDAEDWAKNVCENIWLILQNSQTPLKRIYLKQIKDIDSFCIRRTGEVTVIINKVSYTLCTSYSDPHEYLKVNWNTLEYFRKRKPVSGLSCRIPKGGYIIDKNQNVIDSDTKEIVLWHIKPVRIKALGDIAIDHDIPISLVLREKKNKLNMLKKISKAYCVISAASNISVTAANANKFCSKLGKNDSVFLKIGYPANDMSEIGKCKLFLMEKGENSMKSDS